MDRIADKMGQIQERTFKMLGWYASISIVLTIIISFIVAWANQTITI